MAPALAATASACLFVSLVVAGCAAETQDDENRRDQPGQNAVPAGLEFSTCLVQQAFIVPTEDIELPDGYLHDGLLPQVIFEAFRCRGDEQVSFGALGVLVDPPDDVERNTSVQMGHVLVLDFFVEGDHPYKPLGDEASFDWDDEAVHALRVEARGKIIETLTPDAPPLDDWPGLFETRYLFLLAGMTKWMDVTHDPDGWGVGYPGSLHAEGTGYETPQPAGQASDQTRFTAVNDAVFGFGEVAG